MRLVILLGGTVFNEAVERGDVSLINKYVNVLKEISSSNKVVVVAGGGRTARRYIELAYNLKAPDSLLDDIGIAATRINALLLVSGLIDVAYPRVPRSYQEVVSALSSHNLVIAGGMVAGQSTDAVAAVIAEYIRAQLLIKMTGADAIYSDDPKKNPNAIRYSEITVDALEKLVLSHKFEPGKYELFDLVALRVVRRSKIPVVVTTAFSPENIFRILRGEKVGTLVKVS